ncbi:polyprenyl synthetase family protein [Eubacteriales bacterium OttesenSCG-928-N14]|nr:polyprenyl synthetase family protein [Eubacteriales bacterium OttesenSCG-928-N14]
MDYDRQYAGYTAQIERYLSQATAGIEDRLAAAMRYSLEDGGKRLRPVLCLGVHEMLGGQAGFAMPYACAVEMIHTYSLIHDDLPCMDDDDMRRGKPSNHIAFDEATAVLAGDGLLSLAVETMLSDAVSQPIYAKECMLAAHAVIRGAGVHGMVAGQMLDMAYTGSSVDFDTLVLIHQHKTGALILSACMAGAHLAGADDAALAAIAQYGEHLGQAFQIVDDILDATASSEQLGKTAGKDADANKTTYVSLFGIDGAQSMAKEHIDNALAALEGFGNNAEFLRETAKMQENRIK